MQVAITYWSTVLCMFCIFYIILGMQKQMILIFSKTLRKLFPKRSQKRDLSRRRSFTTGLHLAGSTWYSWVTCVKPTSVENTPKAALLAPRKRTTNQANNHEVYHELSMSVYSNGARRD